MNSFIQIMLSRRSVRVYKERAVSRSLLDQVLLAGLSAPSAHDSRPWRFLVFQAEANHRVIEALSRPFRHDLEELHLPQAEINHRLERANRIFSCAPVLVLALCSVALPNNALDKSGQIETLMATQSVALAGGQMMQAAHSLGLGTCWFSAPLFCSDALCQALDVDCAQWTPQFLLTLGWPCGETYKEKRPAKFTLSVEFYE